MRIFRANSAEDNPTMNDEGGSEFCASYSSETIVGAPPPQTSTMHAPDIYNIFGFYKWQEKSGNNISKGVQ